MKLALLAGLLAVALLAGAAVAQGAPGIQAQNDRTTAWLRATLHADVPDRTVVVTNDMEPQNSGQFDVDRPLVVKFRPRVVEGLKGAVGPGVHIIDPSGPMLVVHEALHRAETAGCWYDARDLERGAYGDEEGAVQALTLDLLPAWGKRFWGSADGLSGLETNYAPDVARVRAYSRFGSGSRSWRDRAARTWRRSFWGASCEGRAAMVAAATAARG